MNGQSDLFAWLAASDGEPLQLSRTGEIVDAAVLCHTLAPHCRDAGAPMQPYVKLGSVAVIGEKAQQGCRFP
jgi:hypothetical protein